MGSVSTFMERQHPPVFSLCQEPWYAIHTYPRHEKKVASEFSRKGLEVFLPLLSRVRQWSDRRKRVELPLFPCYTFVRVADSAEARVRVLNTSGVIAMVGAGHRGIPIPEEEIESLRTLINSNLPFEGYPFLKIGQRVRVCCGSLAGVEGILVERVGGRKLIVSITGVERSLSICLEGIDVEPV